MLPSGEYLDIGGQDHRYINGMVDYGKSKENYYSSPHTNGGRTEKMLDIMKDSGAIRFIPEANQFQILSSPTNKQLTQIENYVKKNGKVEVEIGKNAETKTYDENDIFDLENDVSSIINHGSRGSSAIPMLGLTAGVSGGALTAALVARAKRDKAARR